MERALKQNGEFENSLRTAQAKFTSKSREGDFAQGIDNSPAMVAQRKKLQSLFGGAIQLRGAEDEMLQGKFEAVQRVEEEVPLQGKYPVQRIVVGYVPTNPATFRTTTTIAYDGAGVPAPNKAFNNTQRPQIYANNLLHGGGAAPVVVGVNHATEDIVPSAALMNRDAVSDIEPEVDHIVPQAQGGVNDNDNARILSKTHNTDGSASRPTNVQKSLRVYENVTIDDYPDSTNYSDGNFLHPSDIGALCDYANVSPGNMSNISNADLAMIGAAPKGNTNKGITVT